MSSLIFPFMNMLEFTDIIGTIAFALSGFMVATKDRLDLLGISIATFMTALGGGIVRDTIAGRIPYAFSEPHPTLLVMFVLIISIIFKFHKKSKIINNMYFIISDSIGLISFSITGALVGLLAEYNLFGVIILAFSTAVGGGLMRDTLLNRIPVILTSELYGTVAIIIGVVIYLLDRNNLVNEISLIILFICGLSLRLLAYYKRWHLPKLSHEDQSL